MTINELKELLKNKSDKYIDAFWTVFSSNDPIQLQGFIDYGIVNVNGYDYYIGE